MKNRIQSESLQAAKNHKNKVRQIATAIHSRIEELPESTWAEANHIGHVQAELNRAYEVLKQYLEGET